MRWEFFWKSGDFASMAVFRTDEDTRRPRRRKWRQRNQYTEDWGNVRVGGEEKDLTQSAQRRSTEVTEKNGVDSRDGISIVEFGIGARD
jgi:hypothetical protein